MKPLRFLLLGLQLSAALHAEEYHGFALARSEQPKAVYLSAVQAADFARGATLFEGLSPVDRLTASLRQLIALKVESPDTLHFEAVGWYANPEQAKAEREARIDYLQRLGYEVTPLSAHRKVVIMKPVTGMIYDHQGYGLIDEASGEIIAPEYHRVERGRGIFWVTYNGTNEEGGYGSYLWNRNGDLVEKLPEGHAVVFYLSFPDEPDQPHVAGAHTRPETVGRGSRQRLTVPPGGCVLFLRGPGEYDDRRNRRLHRGSYRVYDNEANLVASGDNYYYPHIGVGYRHEPRVAE